LLQKKHGLDIGALLPKAVSHTYGTHEVFLFSPRVCSSGCARRSLRVRIALSRGEYTKNRPGCGQASHVADENNEGNYSSTKFESCDEFLK
jgi:hypothetical protein